MCSLLSIIESNCVEFLDEIPNVEKYYYFLIPPENKWYIWEFGLYFSQPSQSEVHRLSVIHWYILCISIPCHFKMMNCQPIREILVISPQVHDLAIYMIIPHPFFSSSLFSSNTIFWSLFKLLFPVLCHWLFSFFFKWLTKPSTPPHRYLVLFLTNISLKKVFFT